MRSVGVVAWKVYTPESEGLILLIFTEAIFLFLLKVFLLELLKSMPLNDHAKSFADKFSNKSLTISTLLKTNYSI